jgi:cytochrome c oxidase cbb3-type subunit 3
MGVGKPDDIVGAVQRGVDMFDCVLPSRSGRTGQGWTARGALPAEMAAERARQEPMLARLRDVTAAQIAADPELRGFALAGGRVGFANNCAGCHGAGGQGAPGGFPSLADDDWLWGGTLDDIHQTIAFGIRASHDETRLGNMPAFVRDGLLSRQEAVVIADYVRSLNGLTLPEDANIELGASLFQDNCAACHGENADGIREIGAPNLTNNIWLYGSDRASIVEGIVNGRGGVMPHFGERLDDVTVKALAVYVHTLGGGE